MSWLDPDGWAGEPEVHGVDGRLIDLPHRGNLLTVMCRTCAHAVRLSGRDICLRFTRHLAAPIEEWAGTLRCGRCGSRQVLVSSETDPAAQGFQESTRETAQVICCRRLNAWLVEAGTDLWAYSTALRDLPTPNDLERAGIRRRS